MIGDVKHRNAKQPASLFKFCLGLCPPNTMSANQNRPFGSIELLQQLLKACWFWPCACWQLHAQIKWPFIAASIFGKMGKHNINRKAKMNRPGIAVGGNLDGAVNKFIDALAIGYGGAIFCQRRGDCNIVNFFESACTLTFQRA